MRNLEMRRTAPPAERWYCMRDNNFGIELERTLAQETADWPDIVEYRDTMMRAGEEALLDATS